MPRKKISEFRAKTILYDALGQSYEGLSVDTADSNWAKTLAKLDQDKNYVIKVDQGVKGRFKKGLVKLDRSPDQLERDIKFLMGQGYRYVLVEPFNRHDESTEAYFSIERRRDGNLASFSKLGGIDVESKTDAMQHENLSVAHSTIASHLGIPQTVVDAVRTAFDDNYFSFLEINPLVVQNGSVDLLDAAVEVDDEAAPFVSERWTPADIRDAEIKTPEEVAIEELASRSQASFRLKVLNEDGSVFLLLSGGGASIVVADAVASAGQGAELANYGEYSGNPNLEETYLYTKEILSLMIRSHAPRKVLIIGGGVANFTDIRTTFKGVERALDEAAPELKKQGIKVFVRRGGPHEAEGLAAMRAFLESKDLLGAVAGPEMVLTDIVPEAVQAIAREQFR